MSRLIVCSIFVSLAVLPTGAARAEDWARESREVANSPGTHISREPTAAATWREIAVQQALGGDIAEAKRTAERHQLRALEGGRPRRDRRDPSPGHAFERVGGQAHGRSHCVPALQVGGLSRDCSAQAEAGDIAEAKRTAARISR